MWYQNQQEISGPTSFEKDEAARKKKKRRQGDSDFVWVLIVLFFIPQAVTSIMDIIRIMDLYFLAAMVAAIAISLTLYFILRLMARRRKELEEAAQETVLALIRDRDKVIGRMQHELQMYRGMLPEPPSYTAALLEPLVLDMRNPCPDCSVRVSHTKRGKVRQIEVHTCDRHTVAEATPTKPAEAAGYDPPYMQKMAREFWAEIEEQQIKADATEEEREQAAARTYIKKEAPEVASLLREVDARRLINAQDARGKTGPLKKRALQVHSPCPGATAQMGMHHYGFCQDCGYFYD